MLNSFGSHDAIHKTHLHIEALKRFVFIVCSVLLHQRHVVERSSPESGCNNIIAGKSIGALTENFQIVFVIEINNLPRLLGDKGFKLCTPFERFVFCSVSGISVYFSPLAEFICGSETCSEAMSFHGIVAVHFVIRTILNMT